MYDWIFGIVLKFDDNGEVDMWIFIEGYDWLLIVMLDNYGLYIFDYVFNVWIDKWGGM